MFSMVIRRVSFFLVALLLTTISPAVMRIAELYEVGQGSVVMVGHNTSLISQYLYSPYGSQKSLTHPIKLTGLGSSYQNLSNGVRKPLDISHNQFGYTGQPADPSTGLMMLGGFRNYAPGIGRFIQPDTYNSFSKQGINNPDAYVSGNPLFFTDPSGHVRDPFVRWMRGFGDGIDSLFSPTDTLEAFESFPSTVRATLHLLAQALQGDPNAIGALSAGYASGEFRVGEGTRLLLRIEHPLSRIEYPWADKTEMGHFFENEIAPKFLEMERTDYKLIGTQFSIETSLTSNKGKYLQRRVDLFTKLNRRTFVSIEVKATWGEKNINEGNLLPDGQRAKEEDILKNGGISRALRQSENLRIKKYARGYEFDEGEISSELWHFRAITPELFSLTIGDLELRDGRLYVPRDRFWEIDTKERVGLNPHGHDGIYEVSHRERWYFYNPRKIFDY